MNHQVLPGSQFEAQTISVIIVNYNGLQWLRACLDSVVEQQITLNLCLEIIVIDNGSSDSSASFVRNTFPNVTIYELEFNSGFAAACAYGIDHSSGEFAVFLNNDTIVPPGTFLQLLEELSRRGLDAIAAIEVPYSGGSSDLARTTIDVTGFPVHLAHGEWFSKGESFFLSAVCLLFRKSMYLSSGGFDTNFFMYFEDIDWFWRLQLLGINFDYSKYSVVRHAGHGSSGGDKLNYNRFLWRNINLPKMLFKNLRLVNLLWILPIYMIVYFLEYLVLLLFARRDLAKSYISAISKVRADLPIVLAKRRVIQGSRVVGDARILAKLYPGYGKARNLRHRLSRRIHMYRS